MSGAQAHFEIFDAADGVRWRLQAANGRYTGHSDQSFGDDTDARRGIADHLRTIVRTADDPAIENDVDLEQSDDEVLEGLRIERVSS